MDSPSNSPPHFTLSTPPPPPPSQNPNSSQTLISEQSLQDRLNSDHDSLPQGTLTSSSPFIRLHSFTKRKKGKSTLKKLQTIDRKYQTLKLNLNPIPFTPSAIHSNNEKLLKRLGLWDFANVQFDKTVKTDLVAQLVASYDPKTRYSFVNSNRIMVNRADLGRAFKLPGRKDKGAGLEVDFDVLSEDSIGFIESFVLNCMLLHEDTWMMPDEVYNWMKMIKEGCPEKVDWASLLWFMVEKELTQGEGLKDCYYASHLQYLIMCKQEEPGRVVLDEEEKEGVVGVADEGCSQADRSNQVQEEVDVGVESKGVDLVEEDNKTEEADIGSERVDLVEENKDVGVESERVDLAEENEDGVGLVEENKDVGVEPERVDLDEENKDVGVESERVDLAEEASKAEPGEGSLEVDCITDIQKKDVDVPERLNFELTLGEAAETEGEEEEMVHDDVMMDLEEGNENDANDDNPGHWQFDAENTASEHTLERCNMENGNELFNYEDINEDAEDIEEGEEGAEDAFDILENHDTLVDDGLTVNFLQTNKFSFSSHGQLGDQPGLGLLESSNDMQHTNSAGPSFYGNGGKRPIEHMSGGSLEGNNKRLRIDGPWNNEPPNFMMYMDGIQQFITKATMMYEAKEQAVEQSNMNQQILLNELQKRDSVIEHLHKSRSEEMQKKNAEIYHLEREVDVMGNLLDRYREALKGTQKAFADYKKRFALPEESIYKDAGPGGLMLTTEEIERRRLKQQEDHRLNCLMLEQKAMEAEEGYARQFATFLEKVCKLDSRLAGLEDEMIELKELPRNRKGTEIEQPVCSQLSTPDNSEGIENEDPISEETNMLEKPASIDTNMTDNENEDPISKESDMLEKPASSDTDMTDNCEGTENEEPAGEACILEQPGTENEQTVSGEVGMPQN